MPDPPFQVLYEAGPCLVVNKPFGVLTQAPPGIDSLEIRVKTWLKEREQKPGNVYLGVPHRLDRPVSGAIVFARHARAARRISEQFEGRLVKKLYWACVEGHISPDMGTWTDQLRKIQGEPRSQVVAEDDPEGRPAVLHYRVLARGDFGSWLEIELATGRTHQVRVQAASRGHPVLGDAFYGGTTCFGPVCEDERMRAIALHGRMLAFRHPMTQEMVEVLAPLPDAWQSLRLPDIRVSH
jgi:RluA family pseudouridine synthase